MRNRFPHASDSRSTLSLADLERYSRDWLLDGDLRMLSERTLGERKDRLAKLLWFLRQRELPEVGAPEVRAFLAYLTTAHREPGGRWGSGLDGRTHQALKPVKPATVKTYFGDLRAFFRYLVAQDVLDVSPMERLIAPIDRPDQIQPFSPAQIDQLLAAAKKSKYRRRDEALILFLLDTGARASEVCALLRRDVDLDGRRVFVEGKGGKGRQLYFGRETTRALWAYVGQVKQRADQALFISERGIAEGLPLTRLGLLQILERLGERAGIQGVRCSPHTLRHTAAVEFLRAGGSTFTLQQMLGHTNLQMTRRYVALAEADLAEAARSHSPADRLLRGKK